MAARARSGRSINGVRQPQVNGAGIAVQRQKITFVQNRGANLALAAIQVNFETRTSNQADLAQLSSYHCRVGGTAARSG
jgi:hypothetical protein